MGLFPFPADGAFGFPIGSRDVRVLPGAMRTAADTAAFQEEYPLPGGGAVRAAADDLRGNRQGAGQSVGCSGERCNGCFPEGVRKDQEACSLCTAARCFFLPGRPLSPRMPAPVCVSGSAVHTRAFLCGFFRQHLPR